MPFSQTPQRYSSDEILVIGLRKGEKDALAVLFTKFYDKITNSLKFKFPSIDLMEIDASYTDGCLGLFEQLKSERHLEISLYNLLYTICIRKVIEIVRKQDKLGVIKNFNISEESNNFLLDDDDDNKNEEYFIFELDVWEDEKGVSILEAELQKLESAMKELSPKCNEIITLKYLNDLSWDDVAIKMTISSDTARKVTAPRCKDDLKNILLNKYGFNK